MTDTERWVKQAYQILTARSDADVAIASVEIAEKYGDAIEAFRREEFTQASVEAMTENFAGGVTKDELRAFIHNVLGTGFVLGAEFAAARGIEESRGQKTPTCAVGGERLHES